MPRLSPQKRQANALKTIQRRLHLSPADARRVARVLRARRGAPLSAHYVKAIPYHDRDPDTRIDYGLRGFLDDVPRPDVSGRLLLYDAGPGEKGRGYEEFGFQMKLRFQDVWDPALRDRFGSESFRLTVRVHQYFHGEAEKDAVRHEGIATPADFWDVFHRMLRKHLGEKSEPGKGLSLTVRRVVVSSL